MRARASCSALGYAGGAPTPQLLRSAERRRIVASWEAWLGLGVGVGKGVGLGLGWGLGLGLRFASWEACTLRHSASRSASRPASCPASCPAKAVEAEVVAPRAGAKVARWRSCTIESALTPSSSSSAKKRPVAVRETKWRGPSTSMSIAAAPASCSATASSAPELPLPTSSTRLPRYPEHSRTCQLCRTSPRKLSRPSKRGTCGSRLRPVATTTRRAR